MISWFFCGDDNTVSADAVRRRSYGCVGYSGDDDCSMTHRQLLKAAALEAGSHGHGFAISM